MCSSLSLVFNTVLRMENNQGTEQGMGTETRQQWRAPRWLVRAQPFTFCVYAACIGSNSVTSMKAVSGLLILSIVFGENQFVFWYTYVLICEYQEH